MIVINKIAVFAVLLLSISMVQAQNNAIEKLRDTGKAFASVARSVSPSVVFIQSEGMVASRDTPGFIMPFDENAPFNRDLLEKFFGFQFPDLPAPGSPPEKRREIDKGSGFIFKTKQGVLSDKSYILTNNHVVENADKIRVQLQNGRELEATLVGSDPQSDVAVLEIYNGELPGLSLGDSSKLEVGEWVIAIGNPFGLSHTLTVGVVSAKGRTSLGISDYEDFIQTDAAINPGNSGGPLVNLDGEVVGINTAIFSRSGGYMGIGFAIPINLAKGIAYQLIDSGEVTRGFIGIVIQPLTSELAESFGLKNQAGILVAQVNDDSPAARAGLKQGDIIVAYQGKPVTSVGDFRNRISLTAPNSREQISIIRDGKRKNLTVMIGKLGKDDMASGATTQTAPQLGLTVQTITPLLANQFEIIAGVGVVVTQVDSGSISAEAGIEPGSVILQVNRTPVNTAAEFRRALETKIGLCIRIR